MKLNVKPSHIYLTIKIYEAEWTSVWQVHGIKNLFFEVKIS
jgi:hypothetical protein